MSAAIEGAIENTPSIGFSLCDFDPNAYLEHSREYIKEIVQNAFDNGMPIPIALNVNILLFQVKKSRELKFVGRQMLYGKKHLINVTTPTGENIIGWLVILLITIREEIMMSGQ